MIQKEITLCGKQVTLAYCFATEISFNILTDEDINSFVVTALAAVNEKKMPDTRKSILLILAAIHAYYESKDKEIPITDKNLMYEATPEDIGNALGTVLSLWVEFNHLPKGEPEDKKGDDEPKNA